MSSDFELRRIAEKREKLLKEQEQLNLQLPIIRRDEIFELEQVRRQYNMKVTQTEARLKGIHKDLETLNRRQEDIDRRRVKEDDDGEDDGSRSTSRRFSGLF